MQAGRHALLTCPCIILHGKQAATATKHARGQRGRVLNQAHTAMLTWVCCCRSCRGKLQEHNNRRRKRPSAHPACQETTEPRPRRTRRTAATAGGHSENEGPVVRSQRAHRPQRTGPFSHLWAEERTTSSSSGVSNAVSKRKGLEGYCMFRCKCHPPRCCCISIPC